MPAVTPDPATSPPASGQRRMRLTGLHHVTLICGDLSRTTAFYRDVLGLALVAQSTNHDDPGSRHFWFGDAGGAPGTLLSFLEYPAMPEGVVGIGSTHHLALGVESAAEQLAWRDYLRERGVECTDVFDRGEFCSIYLRDPDGHIVEIATHGPGFAVPPPASG